MIELQCLNYCLANKNFQFFRLNDITVSYFPNYKEEYEFIESHYDSYQNVPDKETYAKKFPEFQWVEVAENEKYLIDALTEEYVYNTTVPIVQQVASKLKGSDSREAVEFLLNKIPELNKKLTFDAVDLIKEADIRYNNYVERTKNPEAYYYKTGLKELDSVIGGWDAKEDLIVVSAQTNHGKSWWLIYFLLQVAMQGKRVGMYSGEMSEDKVGYRVDTFFGNISNFALTRGNIHIKDEYTELIKNMKEKVTGAFYVITPAMLGGAATVPKLRAFIEKYDLDMLGVDQYSLLDDSGKHSSRNERFENLSMQMKLLQTQLQKPIMVVSQLNRGAASKDVEDPGTEHIAGSNRIAEDATMILSLNQKDNNIELRVMKGRDCPKGSKLVYNWNIDKGEFTYIQTEDDAFTNMQRREQENAKYQGKPVQSQENPYEEIKRTYQDSSGEPF